MRKSRLSRVKQRKLIEHFVAGTTARCAAATAGRAAAAAGGSTAVGGSS